LNPNSIAEAVKELILAAIEERNLADNEALKRANLRINELEKRLTTFELEHSKVERDISPEFISRYEAEQKYPYCRRTFQRWENEKGLVPYRSNNGKVSYKISQLEEIINS